jgi:hypothetical protein
VSPESLGVLGDEPGFHVATGIGDGDPEFTPLEQTIMDSGDPERVVAMREDFQRVMKQRYEETIKRLTGRNVVAFLSQAHVEPDITIEIFFVDGPLPGFGAVEITQPELLDSG